MTAWFAHGAVQASAAVAAFVPTDIPDLELWLDADDSGTITETSGEVSDWDDKSASINAIVQGNTALQGNTSTINTNASIFFDGTGERMRDATGLVTSPPGTLAAVFTPTSVATTGDADVVRLRLGFDAVMRIYRNGDDLIVKEGQGAGSTGLTIADTLVVNETRWAIFRARNSGAGASDVLDDAANSASGSLAAAIDDMDDINIAANADGTNDWTGHIHEIVYYNRFLTDQERTDLGNYFNAKWSL